jgi:cobalt-zinc-cadmium efflux system protein
VQYWPVADHTHDHGSGHGHSHAIADDAVPRWLAYALAVNVVFMLVEVATGLISGSLALLSDAAHMLTDAAAIALALLAAHLARRRPEGSMTFGYRRSEILSALVNGMTLLILAVVIVVEAIQRLAEPPSVDASLMFAIGLAGLFANLLAAYFLARANRQSLNVEGAFQHNLIDAYASIGTVLAAVLIWAWGFERADAIASLLIAIPMVLSGWGLVRASGRILLEAAPVGADPEKVGPFMVATPGVVEVHDLHVWEVSNGFVALSAHVTVGPDQDCHAVRREVETRLHDEFGLEHTTLQVDHEGGDLLTIEPAAAPPGAAV